MADVKDKVKDAIDTGSEKAKKVTDAVADKASEGTRKAGQAIKDTGEKIKNAGK